MLGIERSAHTSEYWCAAVPPVRLKCQLLHMRPVAITRVDRRCQKKLTKKVSRFNLSFLKLLFFKKMLWWCGRNPFSQRYQKSTIGELWANQKIFSKWTAVSRDYKPQKLLIFLFPIPQSGCIVDSADNRIAFECVTCLIIWTGQKKKKAPDRRTTREKATVRKLLPY